MWVSVEHGDDWCASSGREELVENGVVARREAVSGAPGTEDQVGGGQADHVDGDVRALELLGGFEDLCDDGACANERDPRGGVGLV